VTPQLISVQDFAFPGSLRIVLQLPARKTYTHETYVYPNKKKRTTNQTL